MGGCNGNIDLKGEDLVNQQVNQEPANENRFESSGTLYSDNFDEKVTSTETFSTETLQSSKAKNSKAFELSNEKEKNRII